MCETQAARATDRQLRDPLEGPPTPTEPRGSPLKMSPRQSGRCAATWWGSRTARRPPGPGDLASRSTIQPVVPAVRRPWPPTGDLKFRALGRAASLEPVFLSRPHPCHAHQHTRVSLWSTGKYLCLRRLPGLQLHAVPERSDLAKRSAAGVAASACGVEQQGCTPRGRREKLPRGIGAAEGPDGRVCSFAIGNSVHTVVSTPIHEDLQAMLTTGGQDAAPSCIL